MNTCCMHSITTQNYRHVNHTPKCDYVVCTCSCTVCDDWVALRYNAIVFLFSAILFSLIRRGNRCQFLLLVVIPCTTQRIRTAPARCRCHAKGVCSVCTLELLWYDVSCLGTPTKNFSLPSPHGTWSIRISSITLCTSVWQMRTVPCIYTRFDRADRSYNVKENEWCIIHTHYPHLIGRPYMRIWGTHMWSYADMEWLSYARIIYVQSYVKARIWPY